MPIKQSPQREKTPLNSFIVPETEAGAHLRAALATHLELSGKRVKALLDARSVFVNKRRVWMAKHVLKAGDRIEVLNIGADPLGAPVVLFEDDAVIVVDKPASWLAVGTRSVETYMRRHKKLPALAAVHRLDKDTTGCMILAKTPKAAAFLEEAFRTRKMKKTYHAIANGRVSLSVRRITERIDDEPASTKIHVLDTAATASHLRVKIVTGRTHQIRRHLAGIRHPVVGDRKYGQKRPTDDVIRETPRQMLHAHEIAFPHPREDRIVRVRAPLPMDFREALRKLGLQ